MTRHFGDTTKIDACLARWRETGDKQSENELIERAHRRLRQIASKMLRGFPAVRREEQTDDILQSALVRLHKALAKVRPKSVEDYMRFSGAQIRRELLDLARRQQRLKRGGKHRRQVEPTSISSCALGKFADTTSGPATLAEWSEFHERAGRLPAGEREVFDLHFYCELSLPETAEQLGISERTAKRRWRAACVTLSESKPD